MAAAHFANDPAGAALVSDLWLQQVESVLVGMTPAELVRHFKSKKAWRVESGRPVYLLGTEPCLAYSPVRYMDGELDVILLGTCYRLPAGGAAAWWTQSIQPRMRGL
jgi:hypothetical protein